MKKAMIRKSRHCDKTYRKQPVDERRKGVHAEYLFELRTERFDLVGCDGTHSLTC